MAILQVNEDDEIMLVTDGGKILRMIAKGISLIGRVTQGVKLMDLEAGRTGGERGQGGGKKR